MALTAGTRLASYEITALLGKGGMGEVYRARDLKLKREVSIKILPDERYADCHGGSDSDRRWFDPGYPALHVARTDSVRSTSESRRKRVRERDSRAAFHGSG